jgi:outer membrane biosynthesis protein TonB
MPKVKALFSIGVGRLLGSHSLPHVDGVIPNGKILDLTDELIELIGADSFEKVTGEETTMPEETKPTETTPEVTPTPETTPAETTPETVPTPETTPAA